MQPCFSLNSIEHIVPLLLLFQHGTSLNTLFNLYHNTMMKKLKVMATGKSNNIEKSFESLAAEAGLPVDLELILSLKKTLPTYS